MAPMMTAMFGKPVTLATAPGSILAAELKLDAGQKKRIDALQDKLDKEIGGVSKGARPSDGFGLLTRMNDIVAQADKDIEAELSGEQKPLAVALLKNLSMLREAGIPPELYLELKLSGDQMKSLTDALPEIRQENKDRISATLAAARAGDSKKAQKLRSGPGEKVSAILTKEQRGLIGKYGKKHPQMMAPGVTFPGT